MQEPETESPEPKNEELSDEQLDGVSGGTARTSIKEPVPGGPVPIPYPNVTTVK
jgi:hypothetical protein